MFDKDDIMSAGEAISNFVQKYLENEEFEELMKKYCRVDLEEHAEELSDVETMAALFKSMGAACLVASDEDLNLITGIIFGLCAERGMFDIDEGETPETEG